MRAVTRTGSKRTLTAKRLTVDWHGYGTLFYWMTKTQMRKVLAGAKRITIQGKQDWGGYFRPLEKQHTIFKIYRRSDGRLSIGCESFTKDEVKELRQWSKK